MKTSALLLFVRYHLGCCYLLIIEDKVGNGATWINSIELMAVVNK